MRQRKMIIIAACTANVAASLPALARDGEQWSEIDKGDMYSLMKQGAVVTDTDTMVLPDGRSAVLTHLKDKEHYYRCMDRYDNFFRPIKFECYQLVNVFH